MIKLKDILLELEFSDKEDFSSYKSKHDIRPSTIVTIDDKKIKAGDIKNSDTIKTKSDDFFKRLNSDTYKKLNRDAKAKLVNAVRKESEKKELELGLRQDFSEEEDDAVSDYFNITYKTINPALRNNKPLPQNLKKTVQVLDKLIAKRKLKQDIIVYRGVDGEFQGPDAAFTSVSIDPFIAFSFARGENPKVKRYKIPAGTNFAYLSGQEREIILPRNTDLSNYEF